jgi:hypothetical protein
MINTILWKMHWSPMLAPDLGMVPDASVFRSASAPSDGPGAASSVLDEEGVESVELLEAGLDWQQALEGLPLAATAGGAHASEAV